MANHDWVPKLWSDWRDAANPFASLRRQIDTVLEDFDHENLLQPGDFAPRSNVSETDSEICITAEMPGLSRDDVDVEISGDTIVIRGEKKAEEEEKGEDEGRRFHRIERRSGSFGRVTRLPFEIDPEQVQAEVKDGILTVTIAKPETATAPVHKVEIKTAS
ncbi:MAG: Hsp20/alpha crystallin family protein [Maritimibacter sp.]|jgi:HSP20 family protein